LKRLTGALNQTPACAHLAQCPQWPQSCLAERLHLAGRALMWLWWALRRHDVDKSGRLSFDEFLAMARFVNSPGGGPSPSHNLPMPPSLPQRTQPASTAQWVGGGAPGAWAGSAWGDGAGGWTSWIFCSGHAPRRRVCVCVCVCALHTHPVGVVTG